MLRDDAAVLFRPGDDFNERVLEILHRDDAAALACRKERALVEQVRKVSPGESGGRLGEGCKIDVVGQRLVAGMHLQDGLAAAPIRAADVDLPVETAGAEQRRVENVLPVCRGDDDDALVGREAVHLDEQLVERLFALIVSAAKARASAAAHGVDLVDEHDGGGDLLRLFEQVAHAARADADVQLHKVRAGDRQERYPGFPGNCAGDQRFAGARRADEQNALRDFRAHGGEALWVAQEFDDLGQLFLFLVRTGHVLERDSLVRGDAKAGVCVGELRHPAGASAVGPRREEEPEQHNQPKADDVGQDGPVPRRGGREVVIADERAVRFLRGDRLVEIRVERLNVAELDGHVGRTLVRFAQVQGEGVSGQNKRFDLFLFKQIEHAGIRQPGVLAPSEQRRGHGRQDQHQNEQQEQKVDSFWLLFQ